MQAIHPWLWWWAKASLQRSHLWTRSCPTAMAEVVGWGASSELLLGFFC